MDTNKTSQTSQPTPSFGVPAYYLGRPNTVFLEKYGTQVSAATA